ncbi:MAG: outer membrane protein [Chloroflexi bacterium]|nr:outer membrane protein [Chloroflexota bacterium]
MNRRSFFAGVVGLAGAAVVPWRSPAVLSARSLQQNPVQLGGNASLGGRRPFPDDNPWNLDVSQAPMDPDSASLLASIGLDTGLHPDFGTVWNGAPNGIPYVVVTSDQPVVPISAFDYADESDAGPYPIPPDAPIEGGPNSSGDRHVLVIDRDNWQLYELYDAHPESGGASWRAGSGAIFNLGSNDLRPAGWTSADAAGLPIFPGLVRYDEGVGQGAIRHALRFTARRTRRAYVPPARHFASRLTDPGLPPMGMRVRLRSSFDLRPFRPSVRPILIALQTYGMFLADNGSDWYISGAPDPRWNDDELATLRLVKGRDFEVVRMDGLVVN